MRSKRLRLIVLIGVSQALGGDHAAAGTLIERTLAFVNKRPVLLSDVQLTQALLQLGEPEALERTIDESLMFDEASRLLNEAQLEETIGSAVQALQEKAGSTFSAAALRRKAIIQLVISSYIDLRLRPLVRVDDAEVRKIFNEKALNDSAGSIFSSVAPSIRAALERRSLDQKIEEWVTSLRRREEIRRPVPRP